MPHDDLFPGWHLIGRYPEGDPDGVASWLLHAGNQAALIEVPPGLTLGHIMRDSYRLNVAIEFATASHTHEDHFSERTWESLPFCKIDPSRLFIEHCCFIGGEPLWIVPAPKHSLSDIVVVFRGVAATGDLELGTLESVNSEVPLSIKRLSFEWLRGFQARRRYRIHTVVSAHLNDIRTDVVWEDLFPH